LTYPGRSPALLPCLGDIPLEIISRLGSELVDPSNALQELLFAVDPSDAVLSVLWDRHADLRCFGIQLIPTSIRYFNRPVGS
jgi:hypothetical protein